MRKNKEFVSRIVNDLRAISKDGKASRRHILHVGKEKAAYLISQKWDELTMTKEEGLITHVPCVEFESIDIKRCDIFEFKMCTNLMKSKCKIPGLIFGKTGPAIVHITNVDGETDFNYITPSNFNSIKKRKYVIRDSKYYYIKDGYIYLPNSTTELLDISVITMDKKGAEAVSNCSGKSEVNCKSIWDYEFVCPDRFYDIVAKDTIQEMASIWRTSVVDENPNMNSNEK